MTVFLSSDEGRRIVYIRFQGAIGDDEAVSYYRRLAAWFIAHGYRSNITDFSAVTSFTVTTQTVNKLAANTPLVPNGFHRIMVAPQDSVFGCARMYEMLGSGTRDTVHVVRTMAEACQLLGVESLDLEPVTEW
jgi:hypothetical protein